MVKQRFTLQPSRLAKAVQLVLLSLLLTVLYSLLPLAIWLLCAMSSAGFYLLFLRRPQPLCFEHLAADEWSLQYTRPQPISRVIIRQIVDHQLYIVIYFKAAQSQPVLVWRDQLSFLQWKQLRMLAKLY